MVRTGDGELFGTNSVFARGEFRRRDNDDDDVVARVFSEARVVSKEMVAGRLLRVCRVVVVGERTGGGCDSIRCRRSLLLIKTQVARAPGVRKSCLGAAARCRSRGNVVWASDRETRMEF